MRAEIHRGITRRSFLWQLACAAASAFPTECYAGPWLKRDTICRPRRLIGYTQFRTDLPGGRYANVVTMRACVAKSDGAGSRVVAQQLIEKPGCWTQFAGWSPNGNQAIIGAGWESTENGAWEEAHHTFRYTSAHYRHDDVVFDLKTGHSRNVTAVERVSFYNSGLFFWPGNPRKFGFVALIGQDSHPFSMDSDGRNKKDLTGNSREFAYGFNASPDGKRIAYHKSYQIYLADADGSNSRRVETNKLFNFGPQWSPNGEWVLFLAGEHENSDLYTVHIHNLTPRKVASRGGYRGSVEFLDVPDFHHGSSDLPVWSPDGRWIYYTAKIKASIELMRVSLDGRSEQLTRSRRGTLNYHPQVSPDGKWIVFGSNRSGIRQLYVADATGQDAQAITHVRRGFAAMWPHWQPKVDSEYWRP